MRLKALLTVFILLVFVGGCLTKEVVKREYVCPDGTSVENPRDCVLPEKEVITKYVCVDGSTVSDPALCPKPTTTTITTPTRTTPTTVLKGTPTTTYITSTTTTATTSTTSTTTSSTTSTTSSTTLNSCIPLGCDADTQFVGSKNSDKYHYCTCSFAKRIKRENIVCFDSLEDARNAGYVPCSVCKPP